ncbi:MAG: FtsX-like permease family protein [Anaerolineae bacterium]|nr:FtsX-like permease family protein [Anaerolineae bacterium]
MSNWRLWLRWSWRDLRARWLQVIAIAMIIALGTGVYAGLGGQETWRIDSLDESYARLNMYDLRLELANGSYVDEAALEAALTDIEGVTALEPRLTASTLVDASTEDEVILVEGLLVSVDLHDGGPYINQLYVDDDNGRTLTADDAGINTVVVDYAFADYHTLEVGDPIQISGGEMLDFVGLGQQPEYFYLLPDDGTFVVQGNFAILYMPLSTIQQLTGREGLVNGAAFLIAEDADPAVVQAEIERRMLAEFSDTGYDFNTQAEDPTGELMYADAEGDQEIWNMVAMLFLIGAALGAFNLAGRIVESQRRQIGIGMALGLPRKWIAFRPMLVGLQIAVLGTIFGLLIGLGLGALFADLLKTRLPLPYWKTSLYMPGYIQATLLGILLPFIATLIPVIRAVRVNPIDAIRSGHLVAKGGGLNSVLAVLPIPGKSFTQMPFRNIFRSPWRSLLTILGISMAIILMTTFLGFLDSFVATMDRVEDAYLHQAEDRMVVNLDFFYPMDNGEISGIRELTGADGEALFQTVDTSLMVGGSVSHGDEEFNVLIELHDMATAMWTPKLLEGDLTADEPGLIIAEKAAADLGVDVGDTVTLEHPLREGPLSFRFVEVEMRVIGIHNHPMRPMAYMDISAAEMMGLDDTTNLLLANPAAGVDPIDVKRALLSQPGVASVQEVQEIADGLDEILEAFVQMLQVVQVIVLLMAFLIAFNSTSINVDERVREIATMFAFGLPIRTATRMQVVENLIIGVLGTVIGVVLGWLALNALMIQRVEDMLEDFGFIVTIEPTTLALSMILGILVVALTPLLSIRRMRKMDIPSTLRVME